MDPSYEQLSLFENKPIPDPRPPETVTWNGIHGCRKVSPGCLHCYMFRRDESVEKDPTIVRKTQSFNLPVRRLRRELTKDFTRSPPARIYSPASRPTFSIKTRMTGGMKCGL